MEGNEPDLSRLEGLLLASRRTIQLAPRELINEGLSMRLTPARAGKLLDCEYIDLQSLPVLDLVVAGIETDRRPETIFAGVQRLLEGRNFKIGPNFALFKAIAILPKIAEAIAWKSLVIDMSARSIWRPSSFHPMDELTGLIKGFPWIGFSISADGEALKGLDLSKTVVGYIAEIVHFVLPGESLVAGSAECDAFNAAVDYSQLRSALAYREAEHAKYLEANKKKWLFWLFNREKKWQRGRDMITQALAEASSEASEKISAFAA